MLSSRSGHQAPVGVCAKNESMTMYDLHIDRLSNCTILTHRCMLRYLRILSHSYVRTECHKRPNRALCYCSPVALQAERRRVIQVSFYIAVFTVDLR